MDGARVLFPGEDPCPLSAEVTDDSVFTRGGLMTVVCTSTADKKCFERWFRARVRELLELGVRDGTLLAEDPALTAFVLCGAVIGVLAQWHSAPGDVEMHCDEQLLAQQLVARLASGGVSSEPGEDEFDFGRSRDT